MCHSICTLFAIYLWQLSSWVGAACWKEWCSRPWFQWRQESRWAPRLRNVPLLAPFSRCDYTKFKNRGDRLTKVPAFLTLSWFDQILCTSIAPFSHFAFLGGWTYSSNSPQYSSLLGSYATFKSYTLLASLPCAQDQYERLWFFQRVTHHEQWIWPLGLMSMVRRGWYQSDNVTTAWVGVPVGSAVEVGRGSSSANIASSWES